MIYRFGDCELDEGIYQLRRDGQPQKLSPKSFDLLRLLVRSGGRVVSKTELFDAIWPTEHVGDSVLPVNVTAVRKALGADAGMIQTVHGRGYRFVGKVDATRSSPDPAPRERSLFVGRQELMTEIEACMEKSFAGERWILLVEGEPGIGKSRVLEEIRDCASARGATALVGRCYEGEGAPAFWPWAQIRRGGKAVLDGKAQQGETQAAELREIARSLGRFARDIDSSEIIPTAHRFQLFARTVQFISAAAAHGPVALLFDDLHCADEGSLELLRHLVAETGDVPLLLVGAYRDTELRRTHPLSDALARFTRDPRCTRFALRGLDEEAVEQIVCAVSKTEPAESFVRALFDMTEGNPFFVHEMLRLLDTRRLDPATATDPRELGLPRGIRDVVGQRLNTLSDDCNELLRLASVVGRRFEVQMLARLADAPAERVLHLLDEAVQSRLVSSVPGRVGVFRFEHSLIRETLYAEVSGPHRVLLHGRVVKAIERQHTLNWRPLLSELAYHSFQAAPAGNIDQAVHYCMQASRASLGMGAYEQAVRYIEWAAGAAELRIPANDRQKAFIDLWMGHALWQCGDYDRARKHFFQTADTARALRDAPLLAHAALGLSSWPQFLYQWHELESNARIRELLAEALETLGDARPELRSPLLAVIARSGGDGDTLRSRSALAREAVSLARRTESDFALFEALRSRVTALTDPGMIRERLRTSRALLEVSRKIGSRTRIFLAHEARALSLLAFGKVAKADIEMAQAERTAEGLELPAFRYSVLRYQLARALGDGDFRRARALRDQIPEVGRRAGDTAARAVTSTISTWILIPQGKLAKIGANLESIYRLGQLRNPVAIACFSYFFARLGKTQLAHQTYEIVAADDFAMVPNDDDLIWLLSVCVDCCLYQRDRERASTLYRRLEPFAELNVVRQHMRLYRGAAAHFLGLLAALIGDRALARDHFENALEMNRAIGARPALAETQVRYASFLRAGSARERAKAETLVEEARETSQQIGVVVTREPDLQSLF